jgi:hypothetical protein
VRYTNPVFITSTQGTNPDLQPGDVLLEVEWEPFETLEAGAAALRPRRPANWEIGETVRDTLLRDGSEVVVPVSLQRPSLTLINMPLILQGNGALLVSFLYLLMGGILFLLRPVQRASQLLLLSAIILFVGFLVIWGVGSPFGAADLFSLATYWPRIIIGGLLWILIWPILAHLFLIFPLRKGALKRFPLIVPLIYFLPVLLILFNLLLIFLDYDFSDLAFPIFYNLLFLLIITLSLVHSLLTIREPVPRMQIRWIAFGGLIGIVGLMIVALAEEIMKGAVAARSNGQDSTFFWFDLIQSLLSAALPLSLAIAILRYRLWDIDIIINRSLVYGTLTGVLALIYFGSVVLLEALFRTLTGQGSTIAIVISTLVIAGLFSPLRRRVQLLIDRRFYRRKYDAEQILGRFAASVRDEADLDRLTAELQRVAKSAMQAEHVSIWLKEPAGAKRRS